jgi:hypothetical protein
VIRSTGWGLEALRFRQSLGAGPASMSEETDLAGAPSQKSNGKSQKSKVTPCASFGMFRGESAACREFPETQSLTQSLGSEAGVAA